MPRRSGGGMRSSGSRSPPRRSAAAAAPPRQAPPAHHTPTPHAAPMAQPQAGGMMSGLAGTVMTGMAFGAGSEIAHQAVRGIMGSGSGSGSSHAQEAAPLEAAPAQQTQQDPCYYQNQDFMSCLQRSSNDISACQSFLDVFKTCREQSR